MMPLFLNSFNAWLNSKNGHLLNLASSAYPGNDATDADLVEAARRIGFEAMLTPPTLVPRESAGVTLQPFDKAALPRGVPGAHPDRMGRVKVRIQVQGCLDVLTCNPNCTAPRGGWPNAFLEGSEIVAELIEDGLTANDVKKLIDTLGYGIRVLSYEMALHYQPIGTILEHFRDQQTAARHQAAADEKTRKKLEWLGFAVV